MGDDAPIGFIHVTPKTQLWLIKRINTSALFLAPYFHKLSWWLQCPLVKLHDVSVFNPPGCYLRITPASFWAGQQNFRMGISSVNVTLCSQHFLLSEKGPQHGTHSTTWPNSVARNSARGLIRFPWQRLSGLMKCTGGQPTPSSRNASHRAFQLGLHPGVE